MKGSPMSPSHATHVTVVRHGETTWNVTGRQQGHLDGELSELGVAQAEAVARGLSDDRFDALYSSDLGRSVQTAEILGARLGLEVVTDARLREKHLGCLQGMVMADFEREQPELYACLRSDDPDFALPGGESTRQVYDRSVACTNDLARRHAGERLLVVSHGGILGCFLRHALGLPILGPRNYALYNASINVFTISDDVWRLEQWGLTDHLRDLGTIDDW